MKQIKETSSDALRSVKAFVFIQTADRKTLMLTVMLLVALTVLALVTAVFNRNSAADTISAVTHASSVGGKAVLASPKGTIRTERVTAFPHGFEPDEITRPKGAFMLCVDNRAGSEALSLQLTSGTHGGPVYAAPIEKGKSGTNKELSLTPGVYILTEGSHPGWICTITITQ